jgi:hypothetical protein
MELRAVRLVIVFQVYIPGAKRKKIESLQSDRRNPSLCWWVPIPGRVKSEQAGNLGTAEVMASCAARYIRHCPKGMVSAADPYVRSPSTGNRPLSL